MDHEHEIHSIFVFLQENAERDCTYECGPDKTCHLETCCIDRLKEGKLVDITTTNDTAGHQRHVGSTSHAYGQMSVTSSSAVAVGSSRRNTTEPSSGRASACNTDIVLSSRVSNNGAINNTVPSGVSNNSVINNAVPSRELHVSPINPPCRGNILNKSNGPEIVTLTWGDGPAIQAKPNRQLAISVISDPQRDDNYATRI